MCSMMKSLLVKRKNNIMDTHMDSIMAEDSMTHLPFQMRELSTSSTCIQNLMLMNLLSRLKPLLASSLGISHTEHTVLGKMFIIDRKNSLLCSQLQEEASSEDLQLNSALHGPGSIVKLLN